MAIVVLPQIIILIILGFIYKDVGGIPLLYGYKLNIWDHFVCETPKTWDYVFIENFSPTIFRRMLSRSETPTISTSSNSEYTRTWLYPIEPTPTTATFIIYPLAINSLMDFVTNSISSIDNKGCTGIDRTSVAANSASE